MEEKNYKENGIVFCKHCGAKNTSDSDFCVACGDSLEEERTSFSAENISSFLGKKEPVSSDLIKRILYIFGVAALIAGIIIGIKANKYMYDDSILPLVLCTLYGFLSMITCFAFGNIVSNIAYIAKVQSDITANGYNKSSNGKK